MSLSQSANRFRSEGMTHQLSQRNATQHTHADCPELLFGALTVPLPTRSAPLDVVDAPPTDAKHNFYYKTHVDSISEPLNYRETNEKVDSNSPYILIAPK